MLLLTEVNYRTGARLDMAGADRGRARGGRAHHVGPGHSAGAFPVDLGGADADFAVGCGYKYLNGGPGAPAFIYAAPRHLDGLRQPLTGWLGHAAPFSFAERLPAGQGHRRDAGGTPPVISMSALDAALDVFDGVDLPRFGRKADRAVRTVRRRGRRGWRRNSSWRRPPIRRAAARRCRCDTRRPTR